MERSEGVPFFAVSWIQGLARTASSPPDERRPDLADEVPWTVAQSVRQRVAALPARAQEILRAAAIVGRVAQRAVLVALAAQTGGEVLDALEAVCDARLLEEEGTDAYRFTHDVVREVVEGDLSTARRAALHQRVAEVLEGVPGTPPVETLAYHYAQSDAVDKAILYLEQAADRALAQSAYNAAERYYRDLLQRHEGRGRQQDVAQVCARLGLLFQQVGNMSQAMPFLQRAATTAGSVGSGHSVDRGEELRAGGNAATNRDAELYLARAALALHQDRLRDCVALAEDAAEVARTTGNATMRAQALQWQGVAQMKAGSLDQAVSILNEAREHYERLGALGGVDSVLRELVCVHELRGDFSQAYLCNARSLTVAEEIGDPRLIASGVFLRASLEIESGAWEWARADLERAIQLVPKFARSAYILSHFGLLAMLQGAWTDAAVALEEAVDCAAGDMQAQVMAERYLAELDLLRDRPAAALSRLRGVLDRDEVHDTVFMLPLVAWAHLLLGDVDRAERVAVQAVAQIRGEQTTLVLPEALRVQSLVAIERGQWTEAQQHLEEGLTLSRTMPYPYAEARLLHIYSVMESRRGAPDIALDYLDGALRSFRRLGAKRDIERVERDRAALLEPRQGVMSGA
ncbi:MAG: hypothetical protein NVSMB65_15340 [Chloroflexota bacterium]